MVVQQGAAILVILQEKMSARPSTAPYWMVKLKFQYFDWCEEMTQLAQSNPIVRNPLYRWEVRNLLEYKEVEVNKSVVETEIPPILIHLGCYNTIPEAGWLRKSRILFLTVREVGKSKINILEDSVSGEKLLLPRWPSSLCFHIVEKAKELSLVDLFSSLIFKFLAIQCNMQNFAN